jgi:GR25 family glycosyltransferase involved in LPS biosynthesis
MSKNIDKIIYINLEKRKDRREEIESELDKIELPYERFNAVERKMGLAGCGYSHLEVLKIAKRKNYKNILILEDDFMFLVSKEEFENQLTQFFDIVTQYDVCMISYNVLQNEPVSETDVVKRLLEAQTASGYIVNNHYYDKLIELYEKNIPILEQTGMHWIYANDQVWKPLQKQDKWYYFTTRIGKQRPGYSDNAGCFSNEGY